LSPKHAQSEIRADLKAVGRNTAIYGAGSVISKAVSFLLIPLYTQFLTGYEVGIIVLLEVVEALYNSAAPLGLINSLWRFFHIERERGKEKELMASNYLFILAVNVLLFLALAAGSHWVARVYLSNGAYSTILRWFFLALFLGLSRVFLLSLLRIYEKAVQFIVLAIADFVILLALSIWFVAGLGLGIEGVIYAKVIASALMFLLTAAYVGRRYGFRFETSIVRRSIRYGFPLIAHGVALLVLALSDRVLIKQLISVESSGVYGISYKFGMMMNMVLVTPFVQAWQPLMFRLEKQPNQKETYQRVALHFIQIAVIAWLVISVVSKYLVWLSSPEQYYGGIIIIPWIAFSYLLYGWQNIFKAGALLNNETGKIARYTTLSAILNVALNLVIIPEWGLQGAAVTTVISYLLMVILVYKLSQESLPVQWRWQKMMIILLLGATFVVVSAYDASGTAANILKDVGLIILLPVCMLLFRLVSPGEIKGLLRELRQ